MGDDAVFFHTTAQAIAEQINNHDFKKLFSTDYNVSYNTYFTGFMYAIFGNTPAVMIPINAALHATGGLILILIAQEVCPGKVGKYGGLLAATLFIIFPSSLNWYAQLHKDCYTITGILLVIYSWICSLNNCLHKQIRKISIQLLSGYLLIAFARPYYLQLLLLIGSLNCIFLICHITYAGELKVKFKGTLIIFISLVFFDCIYQSII
jgi:hypothetical protein